MAQPSILEMPGSPGGYNPGISVLCSPTVLDTREATRSGSEYPSAGAASPLSAAHASLEMATALPWVPLPILIHVSVQQSEADREGSPFQAGAWQPGEREPLIPGLSLEPLASFWEP